MMIQPVLNTGLLARLYNTLPVQTASSLIIFGHDIFPYCFYQDRSTRSCAAAVIRRVDNLVILH